MPKKLRKKTALLIIDMINSFDFPEGRALLSEAKKVSLRIDALKERLAKKKIPVIYVNDNFGDWHSDRNEVFAHCTRERCLGKSIAEALRPAPADYFVLKPKHSAFFLTPLELLLDNLGIERLILTGIAGNLCVLFTAHDAHMREYEVVVPRDCIASNTPGLNRDALTQLKVALKIQTPLSRSVRA